MSTDPNLSHEAVKHYRETFKLCPNFGRRKEIVSTVKDLNLWKTVLSEWKEQKWNPLKVNWMLSEYERREKSGERSNAANGRTGERNGSAKDLQARISKWRGSNLSCVPEDTGVRFRAGGQTLEEIVTEALRTNRRSQAEIEP